MVLQRALIIAVLFALQSCNLLSPREPELPDSGRSQFQPPVAPAIVISNLVNAITGKSPENLILSLADTSRRTPRAYMFVPTAEVSARFPSLFQGWSANSERQWMLALIARMETDQRIALSLDNGRYDLISPDSAVYISDYQLEAIHSVSTLPTRASGSMRLVILPEPGGLWSIAEWMDFDPSQSDSGRVSWSFFKAQFSN